MTEDILDIAKSKNDYTFLKKIWNSYKYDEDPNETDDKFQLFSLCKENSGFENSPTDNQENACKKLLKNWMLLCSTKKNKNEQYYWCNNINNWIYYEINPHFLNDDIINRILVEAQPIFSKMPNEYYCPFTALNKKHMPLEINKLRIFNDNVSTIKDIMMNSNSDYYCSCRNFVIHCIYIYKTIKSKYCSTEIDKNINNIDTCDIVDTFDLYYEEYLYKVIGEQAKLPDLSSSPDLNINIEECISQMKAKELSFDTGYQSDSSTTLTGSSTLEEPVGKKVPTALGTIAGVSSIMALLYKFTPLGSWINTKILRKDKLLDNMKKNEREFLLNSAHTGDINSGDMIYHIKYNSV